MRIEEILKDVNNIFVEVLDNETIKLTLETVASEIAEWDSLGHIQIVVAIEKHFNFRFTAAEISNWKNVGEMCQAIQKRISIS